LDSAFPTGLLKAWQRVAVAVRLFYDRFNPIFQARKVPMAGITST
jgi:hypothetical protein